MLLLLNYTDILSNLVEITLMVYKISEQRALSFEDWALSSEDWAMSIEDWALRIEHWGLSVEHWALRIEHRGWSIEHWALRIEHRELSSEHQALRMEHRELRTCLIKKQNFRNSNTEHWTRNVERGTRNVERGTNILKEANSDSPHQEINRYKWLPESGYEACCQSLRLQYISIHFYLNISACTSL